MANHWVVQASGAMFSTIEPPGWTFVFGVFVTDQDGTPVVGLKKANFSVWELTTIEQITVRLVTEVNADFPASKMPGVYRVQTNAFLGAGSPSPQEFVFAIRAGSTRGKNVLQGMTTVPIVYLGDAG
jgi:hypothetical protein